MRLSYVIFFKQLHYVRFNNFNLAALRYMYSESGLVPPSALNADSIYNLHHPIWAMLSHFLDVSATGHRIPRSGTHEVWLLVLKGKD